MCMKFFFLLLLNDTDYKQRSNTKQIRLEFYKQNSSLISLHGVSCLPCVAVLYKIDLNWM
jgi:hypothetical protein